MVKKGTYLFCFFLVLTPTATACPFCSKNRGPTLLEDYDRALMVLVGRFANPKLSDTGFANDGTTEFIIETQLKSHAYLKNLKNIKRTADGKTVIVIPKYITDTKERYLLFFDVFRGVIDPWRSVKMPAKSDILTYLKGALAHKKRSPGELLRYYFDFLEHKEFEITVDAYRCFAKAPYQDYRTIAAKLPADKIAGWLRNPKTGQYRYGLYASLLGHCGDQRHAKLVRGILENPAKEDVPGIHGVFASYVMLRPKEGWAYLTNVLHDSKKSFTLRYMALRTIRFLRKERLDLVSEKELVTSIADLMELPDMADFAIDELREWQCWDMTDRVLALLDKESHAVPIIQKAIVKFAVASPAPAAVAYLERLSADPASASSALRSPSTTPAPKPVATKTNQTGDRWTRGKYLIVMVAGFLLVLLAPMVYRWWCKR